MAYGQDGISAETRDALLLSQMQEGLKYELMASPAVSGAAAYKQLCLAARNEEKRLIDLEKRRKFLALQSVTSQPIPQIESGRPENQFLRKYGANPSDSVPTLLIAFQVTGGATSVVHWATYNEIVRCLRQKVEIPKEVES